VKISVFCFCMFSLLVTLYSCNQETEFETVIVSSSDSIQIGMATDTGSIGDLAPTFEFKNLISGSAYEVHGNSSCTNLISEFSANIENDRAILSDGTVLSLCENKGSTHSGWRSILIRPEHVNMHVSNSGNRSLEGVIENIVYFGTDTHFHLTLNSGEQFTVRKQNSSGNGEELELGTKVQLEINASAIQILDD